MKEQEDEEGRNTGTMVSDAVKPRAQTWRHVGLEICWWTEWVRPARQRSFRGLKGSVRWTAGGGRDQIRLIEI